MEHKYTCEECKGTFIAGWTQEEAKAESKELFGEMPHEEMAQICDDCFKKLKENTATYENGNHKMNARKLTDADWEHIFKALIDRKESGKILSVQPDGREIEGYWNLTDDEIKFEFD